MSYREQKVPARALKKQEIQQVISSFQGRHATRNRTLFILMVRTGFRISEALSLRVEDVFQHGQPLDKVTVTRSNMKGKSHSRTIALHREAKEAISFYLTESNLTFGRLFDITRQAASKVFIQAFDIAKIPDPHGTHSARKTFATSMFKRLNNNLVATAKAMGHRSIQSTVSYLANDDTEIDAAILSEE